MKEEIIQVKFMHPELGELTKNVLVSFNPAFFENGQQAYDAQKTYDANLKIKQLEFEKWQEENQPQGIYNITKA